MADYSTYSDAQLEAAYDLNASYLEEGSVAKARAFVSICTVLVRRLRDKLASGDKTVEKNVGDIREEKDAAAKWLAGADTTVATGAGPRVTKADLRSFRE